MTSAFFGGGGGEGLGSVVFPGPVVCSPETCAVVGGTLLFVSPELFPPGLHLDCAESPAEVRLRLRQQFIERQFQVDARGLGQLLLTEPRSSSLPTQYIANRARHVCSPADG